MPGMNWTAEANQKLLLSILVDADIKPNYENLAKRLSVNDTVCTPRAVQEQIKKLKKQAQDEGWNTAENGGPEADGGPIKPKATRSPRKKKADGEVDGESPTKKRKAPAAKTSKSPKTPKSPAIVKEDAQDDAQDDAEVDAGGASPTKKRKMPAKAPKSPRTPKSPANVKEEETQEDDEVDGDEVDGAEA